MGKDSITKQFSEWHKKHLPNNLANRVESKSRKTSSGIELPDLFVPDTSNFSRIGYPGEFPFTRGIHATMYRGKKWTTRQYAGFGTAEETNRRYRYLLEQGNNGISVAFDLPTQMGHDSDEAPSRGEVGRVGVAIDTIEDMEALFDSIPLDKVSTSMTINSTAHILLALYLAVSKRRGIDWKLLRGTVQNDILKEYISRGTYIFPPAAGLKISSDIIEFCRDNVPQWNPISISGYHIREAGATAVQELAFTLANGICYVENAVGRGLNIDTFAERLAFFFNCHNNFLEEIAKFRAARRLWANIVRQRFGAKKESSCMLRFHTQTAGSTLTAAQPRVNLVRTTLQALAAVLGGTQSLHTNAFDEALGLPTEEAAQLAIRTQQVIACESGVTEVVDPLGGSYAIEALTDQIEEKVLEYLKRIDDMGGMLSAIEARYPQAEIEESAFRYQQAVERRELEIVGINVFDQSDSPKLSEAVTKIDPALEAKQIAKLADLKRQRSGETVDKCLRQIQEAAREERNLMPLVCEAVEHRVTLGEISHALRAQYGEYR